MRIREENDVTKDWEEDNDRDDIKQECVNRAYETITHTKMIDY